MTNHSDTDDRSPISKVTIRNDPNQPMVRPKWMLRTQAMGWRFLMEIGMVLHRLAHPRPPRYSFWREVKSNFSTQQGSFYIYFYCPFDYRFRSHTGKKYPVVINFHGGGFTIGKACDDARWAHAVNMNVGAVVASVEYRLAPEYPFPTAVKDGVESILYLSEHAEELGLDTDNFAISGFSAGGNMAFSVPLRLQAEIEASKRDRENKTADVDSVYSGRECPHPIHQTLKAIVAWYPSVDFTRPREEREHIPTRPDLIMPKFFTNLFDASYLNPPDLDRTSPYLSPGVAPDHLLQGLPNDIFIYPCEFDGLAVEAERFRKRLVEDIGKNVRWKQVTGVPHAWDKAPNPLKAPPVKEYYLDACAELRKVFGIAHPPPGADRIHHEV